MSLVPDKMPDVESLLELARDRSSRSKAVLFENVSDLFLSDEGRLSDQERALMEAILSKLIHEIERDVRKNLADRLREQEDPPHELIVLLANDTIEIAAPILRKSGVLRDPDLIGIVRQRSVAHLMAVAARPGLSAAVGDSIIERGEPDAIEALIENSSSELSKEALRYLVAESERVDRYRQPLLHREDLPPELAAQMFWWVGAALRRHILNAFDFDAYSLDTLVSEVTDDRAQAKSQREALDQIAKRFLKGLAGSQIIGAGLLTNLLKHGHAAVFFQALAQMSNAPLQIVQRIVTQGFGDGLAVLCRAAELNRNEFGQIASLLHRSTLSTSQLFDHLQFFDMVDGRRCQQIIRIWSRNPKMTEAIEQING